MTKKIWCIVLAALMLAVTVLLAGCGETKTKELSERIPATISVLGITDESTTPAAIERVEAEINKVMEAMYQTHIDLTLVTRDKYEALVRERVALAKYNEKLDSAVNSYNTNALSEANAAVITKQFGRWRTNVAGVTATTITTRPQYTEKHTEINEQGIIEVVYPDAASPIDVFMVIGEDMYDEFDEMGALRSIKAELSTEAFTKFTQFIYPTYFDILKTVKGDVKAIPNNNLLAEYTYIIIDKELAEKYDFDVESVNNYSDIEGFLSDVKAGEDVIPMARVPEALGIFNLFDNEGISIGTYCDPMVGYNTEEGSSYTIQNIFDIPQYKAHAELMDKYKAAGYFESASGSKDFAVDVITGDASVAKIYGDKYDVKIIQNPFVRRSDAFEGMLAVYSKTSSYTRSLEFILELTTNPELKNLFQYGVEDENYSVNEDGTLHILNDAYSMNNNLTGNVYMSTPLEGELTDKWEYMKKTNLDSLIDPYLTFTVSAAGDYSGVYLVTDATLDEIITQALVRASVDEELRLMGSDYTYDYYVTEKANNTENVARVGNPIKRLAKYRERFVADIMEDASVSYEKATDILLNSASFSTTGATILYSYDWYFEHLAKYKKEEKYSNLYTSTGLDTAIRERIASAAGVRLETFDNAVKNANDYYSNIETLRIMTRLIIWEDLSDEEWQVYQDMSAVDFEKAVYNYVRDHYVEENNLDDEKYEELVRAFMLSTSTFIDKDDNTSYKITWDQYKEIKEAAQPSFELIEKLREVYDSDLKAYLGMLYSMYTDSEIPETVHEMLYVNWLSENGYKKSDFETELYNEILAFMDLDYEGFQKLRRGDSVKFAAQMRRIKDQYKSILVEAYSEAQFKNDRISNDNVLSAILAHKIEERTGIYASMSDKLGISYGEYKNRIAALNEFIEKATSLRDASIYTLLTKYTQSQINSFDYNDIDVIVYEMMSESGFYTNEFCRFISVSLSKFMQKKSDAKDYISYVTKLASTYADDIAARGYTQDEFVGLPIDTAKEVLYDIAKEKYFSDALTVEDMLSGVSESYVNGYVSADNYAEYVKKASSEINSDALFTSIVYYLRTALAKELSPSES